MLLLTEGEKDPRPFVQGDFELPGYERSDAVVASEQYCAFLSITGCKLGSREIQKQVLFIREIGERAVKVQVGIDAGGLWRTIEQLTRVYKGINHLLLPWVRRKVEEFEKRGYFDKRIGDMQKEYESGQGFVSELIPAVLARFPQYDLVINRFKKYKYVMFVRDGHQQRGIKWAIGPGEFIVLVSEIEEVLPDDELDIYAYNVKGKRYWSHDPVAVWYPTKGRDTSYNIGDTDRITTLLERSFNTLEHFLEQH